MIVQDADLEYDPLEYPKLLAADRRRARRRRLRLAVLGGDRGACSTSGTRVGNRFLTLAVQHVHRTSTSRTWRPATRSSAARSLQSIRIESHRFGIEPEITAKVARRGYRIYEVPISYYGRDLRGGQEDRLEGRLHRALDDHPPRRSRSEDPSDVGHVTLAAHGALDALQPLARGALRGATSASACSRSAPAFGNMTRYFYGRELVVASDLDPRALELPQGAFRDDPAVRVGLVPLSARRGRARRDRRPRGRHRRLPQRPRAHREDTATLADLFQVLRPGGRIILFVPAIQRALRLARRAPAPRAAIREGRARGEGPQRRFRARGRALPESPGHPGLVGQRPASCAGASCRPASSRPSSSCFPS